MIDTIAREIDELHQFFQDWFTGSIPQTEANFARVTAALAPGFVLISPDGALAEYATVIDWLRKGYGTRPGFRLWVEKIVPRYAASDLALVTYEEWQQRDDRITARLSSAIFRHCPTAPNGVEWLYVHETWLPESGLALRAGH
jgi:hypothetical protein